MAVAFGRRRGFASGRLGANWTPDGKLQLEGESNFSLLGHMKRTQNYFVWGCFPKSLEIATRDLLSSRVSIGSRR
jgi:hypothetical protein